MPNRCSLALALCLLLPPFGFAQAPHLNPPFPFGVQRGTALDLTLTGRHLAGPTGLLASFPVRATFPAANNNGKDEGKLIVRLEVPRDAPLGWHALRLATKRGVSNLRAFCVDDLPNVLKDGAPNAPDKAQTIPAACVVCGKVESEKVDYYRFTAQANQRLSFEVLGRRLGSGLDPQLSLVDAQTSKQIAFSDDAPGQAKDPRFSNVFKAAGTYHLEIRDVRYQGGADWFYRLRVGDFPLATTPYPLAVRRGTTATVGFTGPVVHGVAPVIVAAPADALRRVLTIWPRFTPVFPDHADGACGWPVELLLSDLHEAVEAEPNDTPAQAAPATVPGAVSARFEKKGDKDHFRFPAKKGVRYAIEVQTHEVHSPTSVYLTLLQADGKQVAASDPTALPVRLDFTAPADGDYTLAAEHLHYWGGPEESYRLTILPVEPGFTLSVSTDRLGVAQGAAALLTVEAARQGYDGPIEVAVAGAPGLHGATTIPTGQTKALLSVAAAADGQLGPAPLRVVGMATVNNKPLEVKAGVMTHVRQSLAGLPFPPLPYADALAVAVTEQPPFAFTARFVHPEAARGVAVPVQLTATRAAGFDGEITITSTTPPPAPGQPVAVPPVTVKIPKGQTTVQAELKPIPAVPDGTLLAFLATAKAPDAEFSVAGPVMPLKVTAPFELHVDTGAVVLARPGTFAPLPPGPLFLLDLVNASLGPRLGSTLDFRFLAAGAGKRALPVRAVRKGGYQGAITLELRNLPAGVTAPSVTLAEGQTEAVFTLTASEAAALGKKGDVNVLGTATAAGNQQLASANFTLEVVGRK
jgi:hypothetical protein